MFALPGQSELEFLRGMEKVLERGPKHISFYGLTLEGNSVFAQQERQGRLRLDEALYANEYLQGARMLEGAGLRRYEVSNFALSGHESRHNLGYWKGAEYLGVGPGAHSFLGGLRLAGPGRYPLWRDWVRAGCPESSLEADRPDAEGQRLERLWLSLRTREGARMSDFAFGEAVLEKFLHKHWIVVEDGFVRLAGKGWLFMDSVCLELLG
jgi:oxygen-independent coproporphyrinogen-3 oxidase